MNTKLTLSIDKSTIEQAKVYAKEQGTSVSKLVENYLKMITPVGEDDVSIVNEPKSDYKFEISKLSPEIQQIIGILDENKVIDDDRYNYLMRKYS